MISFVASPSPPHLTFDLVGAAGLNDLRREMDEVEAALHALPHRGVVLIDYSRAEAINEDLVGVLAFLTREFGAEKEPRVLMVDGGRVHHPKLRRVLERWSSGHVFHYFDTRAAALASLD